jgi:hypothetical protein
VSIPVLTPGAIPPEALTLVEQARIAVAQQLGAQINQVNVSSVQAVEWRDASLGCPEPGMNYAQVITPGYLIRLTANGEDFEFHSDRAGNVVTCENPQAPMSVSK